MYKIDQNSSNDIVISQDDRTLDSGQVFHDSTEYVTLRTFQSANVNKQPASSVTHKFHRAPLDTDTLTYH